MNQDGSANAGGKGTDETDGLDRPAVGRRGLLIGLPAAGVATAGCAVLDRFGDDDPGDGGDDGGSPTPTFGYGGTPTPTPPGGETATPTGGETATPTGGETATPTATPSNGDTATDTPSGTAAPADDYGLQGYGEYGYGG